MARFLTPQEMFQEYIEEQNSKEQKYTDYVDTEMQIYAKEAISRMQKEIVNPEFAAQFIISVAEAYIEQNKSAVAIFSRLRLQPMHAYAVLEKYHWFEEELDTIIEHNSEPDDFDDDQVYEA